ncbi:MAG: hypothetical protein EOR00_27145 [Mesorhizobium sp.]|uniref:hypothetical protein n=1 Tax=Mesorhizobium sp. TaxID=1871066 RepID=UPI000FE7B783|nr:hypothetical protein [Mesorhizobium sp.]RWP12302.1 MAG: hypothetical protein EOR00_27145 [Mesorhizobium sp.]
MPKRRSNNGGRMVKAPAQAQVPQLFAVEAMFCGPGNLGSQDMNEGCFCGDAGFFVLKKNDVYPTLPHCEWFCSSLAQATGVPQIPFSVVKHTAGNFWFGSLWMNGRTPDWWNLAQQGSINFSSLADDLSRIYALDLFVHNDDRHMNNYMVVPAGTGHRVYSFDYSRAWLYHGAVPGAIMTDPGLNTVSSKEWMKQTFGQYLNPAVALEVLDRIDGIDEVGVRAILAGHPTDWLAQQQEDEIVDWWTNGARTARIAAIRDGVNDGTLL